MPVTIERSHALGIEIEERHVHAIEHVLFHPTRGSIISITTQSLQEIDPHQGATIGETTYDLQFLSDKPTTAGAASTRQLEHVVPVGTHHVAAIFQSRNLVVWDLRDAVLHAVSEVEKQQKCVAALAASLCKDKWLFYASEGSNSIKVSAVDSREAPKKISRKATNRSSQLSALAYHTPRRVLCAGASDGALAMWLFSEENTVGASAKEEAAVVTPLFNAQTTQSPVVQLTFAPPGNTNTCLLVVAYQNRVVEVWDLASRPREPFRVAVFHCLPPQATDFAKKNGELTCVFHAQLPLLLLHWHAYNGGGSCAAAAELRLHGSSSSGATPVSLSDWHEFLPAAPPTAHDDGNAVLVFPGMDPRSSFQAYMAIHHDHHGHHHHHHHRRDIVPLTVTNVPQVTTLAEETAKLTLSASFQLSVEQYFKYQDVPTTLLQVSRNPETPTTTTSTSTPVQFQLQRYSQISGETEKLDDLAVWKNYQGRQLVPWKMRCNESQTAVCIQLHDPVKAIANEDDNAFSYVVLEAKPTLSSGGGAVDADSEGGGGAGGTSSSVRVISGALMDALDVCFCETGAAGGDTTPGRPFVLLVLAASGKSIGVQWNCDSVDPTTRVVLTRRVQRMFPTPLALTASSPYVSLVGCRLLYVVSNTETTTTTTTTTAKQTLVLSGDDLTVPSVTATGFTTRADGERILDVIWNSGATASSAPSSPSEKMLAAVWTTQRIVVLSMSLSSPSLSVVAEYDLTHDLDSPQSVLWMAQSLLYVTRDQQLRFVAPLRAKTTSTLLCSLATSDSDSGAPQKTQLLSVCSDRLCYCVTDPRSLESRTYLRPMAICEPLLLGFANADDDNGRLKAIFERDFLVFLLTGGQETRSPVSDRLLEAMYHDFGWTDTVTRLLDALVNPSSAAASVAAATSSGGGSTTSGAAGGSGSFRKLSHLSPATVASLLLHAHKWKDTLRVFLASDPALEEYALADDDASSMASAAKLPSRTGRLSQLFQQLASVLASVGQAELAIKCLDLAGDDPAIVELLKSHGMDADSSQSLLSALQRDWNKLHPPLTAITKATTSAAVEPESQSAAVRRHDLFALLCCEQLTQTERRSRLLSSVRPLDKLTMAAQKPEQPPKATTTQKENGAAGRAGILYWKRLSPEDSKDAVGVSMTPHFSADEPKNPTNYSLFHGGISSLGLLSGGSGDADPAAISSDTGNSNDATDAASAKMTIGPFLEDEDAVVAYWRFEEGASASEKEETAQTLESLDTTKRENHLQVLQFGSLVTFATSTAPVDKGEDGKLQEAFALRFPTQDTIGETETNNKADWGAKCAVRPGSTLDIGFVFDDDPYRRKLTLECWVRNATLFRKQQQQQQEMEDEGEGDGHGHGSGGADALLSKDDASVVRRLACRRGADSATWWEFGLRDGGFLFLRVGGDSHTIQSETAIANVASWTHVAFSVDINSPKSATLKLFVNARCVASKEIGNVDANAKPLVVSATKALAAAAATSASSTTIPPPLSTLHLGLGLTDYEMTEVRVWATARTPEQLSDMKENYLGIAETKRRMKITIHQRNCQCEKCLGRRTNKTPLGKGGALLGASSALLPMLPSTPPASSASARDRRRPQPKA